MKRREKKKNTWLEITSFSQKQPLIFECLWPLFYCIPWIILRKNAKEIKLKKKKQKKKLPLQYRTKYFLSIFSVQSIEFMGAERSESLSPISKLFSIMILSLYYKKL